VTRAEGTHIQAAGDVRLSAGGDLTARAVDIRAGQTLGMAAGGNLTIEAERTHTDAETSHAHGGTNHFSLQMGTGQQGLARSSLSAQAIELASGGDTTLSAVNATAERMSIDTGGVLRLQAPVTTARSHSQQSDGDAWNMSASGHDRREDSVNYNHIDVGRLTLNAGGGVQAQVGMRDNLQALAQQPGMGWINQLQQQAGGNEVHWQQVVQASERSSYSRDGFGPAGALVITAIVGAATAGIGNAAGAAAGDAMAVGVGEGVSLTSGGTFLSTTGASIAGAASAAVQMGIANLSSQAAMSFISNEGDLDAVFRDLSSSGSVRQVLASMLTAGVGAAFPGGSGAVGIAAHAVAGCATGELTGQGCRNGAVVAGTLAGLNSLNYLARQDQLASSQRFAGVIDENGNLLTNTSGVSAGVDGDGIKVAGNRINVDKLCGTSTSGVCINFNYGPDRLEKPTWMNPNDGMVHLEVGISLNSVIATNDGLAPSPLGGLQGGAGSIFGVPYAPGSFTDRLTESFAGPHDFLNAPHYYDLMGNNISGASEIWNAVNLVPAAPLGLATLSAQYPGLLQNMVNIYRDATQRYQVAPPNQYGNSRNIWPNSFQAPFDTP